MADFWDHPGDFNLGGFQPAPPSGWAPSDSSTNIKTGPTITDPRLSPLPQPWQQGPISGPAINGGNAQLPPNDFPNLGGVSPQMPSLGPAADMGPNGPTFTNGQGQSTDQFGNLTPQQMQQIGSAFRGTAQRFQGRTPLSGLSPSNAQQIGQGMGQAVAGMGGTPLANGIGQPMNPSQQSGMVLMQSPDGLHMQQVPQAHVDHYTGLGATQVTGPQLTGSSYGGSF